MKNYKTKLVSYFLSCIILFALFPFNLAQALTLTNAYDAINTDTATVSSLDELKSNLLNQMLNRNAKINIIYQGSISNNDIDATLNSILDNDTYLNCSVREKSYETGSPSGQNTINFSFKYLTTKEREDFIDTTVSFVVSKIITTSMNDDEKEKVIHDYVLTKIVYKEGLDNNSAYSALHDGQAACEGYVLLTYKMLKAVGIENIIVSNTDHAWNVVKIDDKWYHLDTTLDDAPQKDMGFYKYYNLTDAKIQEDHIYGAVSGIQCNTEYLATLDNLDKNKRKFENTINDIKKISNYGVINNFKKTTFLNLMYNDMALKEGEEISLVNSKISSNFYINKFSWESSDSSIAEVDNGKIIAMKAGTAIISATPLNKAYGSTSLCTVRVMPLTSSDGKTAQEISQSNVTGFSGESIVPSLVINSAEDINKTTTISDCYSLLNNKVKLIGHPIEIKTTSVFDWAEISFKLNSDELKKYSSDNLVIYGYDDKSGTIVPEATRVDKVNVKVSATVTNFDKYFLFDDTLMYDKTLNISFMIDSVYGTSDSLDTVKNNILETVSELRKSADLRIAFVDNNTENPNAVSHIYLSEEYQPSHSGYSEAMNAINVVFSSIKAQDKIPVNQDEIIASCAEALTKGRQLLASYDDFYHVYDNYPNNLTLIYTKWNGYFLDNNNVIEDCGDSTGLIVGKTLAYYHNGHISYDNTDIKPLTELLLYGDYKNVILKSNRYVIK